jgi:sec-independent protein translocase protein TatA
VPFGLGVWEVVILLAVVALLFGAKGVPDVARRLGAGVREVRDAVADVDPRRMLDAPSTTQAPTTRGDHEQPPDDDQRQP